MKRFGSRIFTNPDHVFSKLLDLDVDLALTSRVPFGAQVSWLVMPCLRLCVIEENAARVAFISLPPTRVFVSFPLAHDPAPVWNGIRLHRNDLVLHGIGERFHHRTVGPARWGVISIAPRDLVTYGRALLGRDLSPSIPTLVRPSVGNAANLVRLHARAARLVTTRPKLLTLREVCRALEQDLIHALLDALAMEKPAVRPQAWHRRSDTMVRFEDALAFHDQTQPLPALCARVGVPPRTLREYCATYLGCSPTAYARLRRLNYARSALLKANPTATSVAEVARSYGFSELGRFAVAYRKLFGESPHASLMRSASTSAEFA